MTTAVSPCETQCSTGLRIMWSVVMPLQSNAGPAAVNCCGARIFSGANPEAIGCLWST